MQRGKILEPDRLEVHFYPRQNLFEKPAIDPVFANQRPQLGGEPGLLGFVLNQPTPPTLQPAPTLGQWHIRIIGRVVDVPAEGVESRDILAGNFGQRKEGKCQI
jgi:hypothetical protein